MKRPIPEGVTLPHPNAIILGWGDEFHVPSSGTFMGWNLGHADTPGVWQYGEWEGWGSVDLYAADARSEVARLNYPGIPESSPTTNPPQISTSAVDERDGSAHITNPDGSKGAKVIFTKREPDELDRAFAEPIPDHIREEEEDPRDGAIRSIIQNWRQRMKSPHLPKDYRNGIETCADELEAALAPIQGRSGLDETPADGR